MTSCRMSRIPPSRRGGMLIIVLVCLIVAATILASVLKLAGSNRREQLAEQNKAQADWLAESALERAVSWLQKDAAYSGEIWKVGPEELQSLAAGEVTIRVENDRQMPEARRIVIVAVFPANSATPARCTKEQAVSLPTPKPKAPDTTE